ncbi:MAG: amidohydrolase family protein, partial [Parvularculaceae bacterium]
TSATPSDESLIQEAIGNALDEGALGIGFGLAYTPGAGRSEVFHLFEMAARRGAPIIVHVRSIVPEDISPEPELQQMQEVVANAAATGVRLHICHVSSTGVGVTPQILELIDGARARGVDVTTEAYPYTAGSTSLTSTIFLPGWQKKVGGVSFDSLVWVKTGERLTETTFKKYREEAMKSGESAQVIIHFIPESAMDVAISHPDVIVASDGGSWRTGREHPRGAGTFSRVLSRYVREKRAIDLVGALRKMTILPAQRLEQVAPQMKKKGRLQEGADADVAVFDPEKIIDKGTYESPMQPSEGVRYLLVNGVLIVDSGVFASGVYPGRAVRGSLSSQ